MAAWILRVIGPSCSEAWTTPSPSGNFHATGQTASVDLTFFRGSRLQRARSLNHPASALPPPASFFRLPRHGRCLGRLVRMSATQCHAALAPAIMIYSNVWGKLSGERLGGAPLGFVPRLGTVAACPVLAWVINSSP